MTTWAQTKRSRLEFHGWPKGVIRVSESGPFSVRFRFVSNIACLFSTTWWLRSHYLVFFQTLTFFVFNNILASLVSEVFQSIAFICFQQHTGFARNRRLLLKVPLFRPPATPRLRFHSARPRRLIDHSAIIIGYHRLRDMSSEKCEKHEKNERRERRRGGEKTLPRRAVRCGCRGAATRTAPTASGGFTSPHAGVKPPRHQATPPRELAKARRRMF